MSTSGWAACMLLIIPAVVSALMLWVSAGICADSPVCRFVFDPARNTVSVDMESASIGEVADIISEKTGAKVLLDRNLRRKISARFGPVPIEQGIRRLLEPTSTAFEFTRKDTSTGVASYRLDTVRIFEGRKADTDYMVFSAREKRKASAVSAVSQEKAVARQYSRNVELALRRNQSRIREIRREMIELGADLSRESSPEKRNRLLLRMESMKNRIQQIYTANTQIIQSEERNIKTPATRSAGIPENRLKFIERQKEARRQRVAAAGEN